MLTKLTLLTLLTNQMLKFDMHKSLFLCILHEKRKNFTYSKNTLVTDCITNSYVLIIVYVCKRMFAYC